MTNAIINAYTSSNATVAQICSEFTISKSKFYKLLDENNIARRSTKVANVELVEEVIEAVEVIEEEAAAVIIEESNLDFSKVTISNIETVMDVITVGFEANDNKHVARKDFIKNTYAAWNHIAENKDKFVVTKRMGSLLEFGMKPSENTVNDATLDYKQFFDVKTIEGKKAKAYALIS